MSVCEGQIIFHIDVINIQKPCKHLFSINDPLGSVYSAPGYNFNCLVIRNVYDAEYLCIYLHPSFSLYLKKGLLKSDSSDTAAIVFESLSKSECLPKIWRHSSMNQKKDF